MVGSDVCRKDIAILCQIDLKTSVISLATKAVMPLVRKDLVSVSLFGGPALPGVLCEGEGKPDKILDPGKVMEAIGSYGQGLIDLEELHKIECAGIPFFSLRF